VQTISLKEIPGDESKEDALIREIEEELKLLVKKETLKYFDFVNVRYREYDFIYHKYQIEYDYMPTIIIDEKEHKAFGWYTPHEALKLDLIEDEDMCIKMFYNI
jgi:8-oxo-dGTP pyrophosphatase MutT (NUDIX family)